jgi:predicted outer membrane repeat protein
MKHTHTVIESLEPRIAPATFVVTSLADSGAGSLREAITLANDALGADIIVFKKGLTGTIDVTSGEMLITDALQIKGPGAEKLALDMDEISRAFRANDGDIAKDSPWSVTGLAFFNGASSENGGAISSIESLKIKGCIFGQNVAQNGGGAVSVQQAFTPDSAALSADIRDSTFVANTNQVFGGGAVSVSIAGSFTLKTSVFARNQSVTAQGGGALSVTAGDDERILVEKSKFIDNTGTFGGGANLSGIGFNGGSTEVVVRNSLFQGNSATEFGGGGVNVGGGSLVFEGNTWIGNSAARDGGGLDATLFSSLTIRSNKFLENVSNGSGQQGGGGLFLEILEGSTAQIIGSEFAGNSATIGGGILVATDPGTLKIVGSKFIGNSALEGGGICSLFVEGGTPVSASIEIVKTQFTRNIAESAGGALLAGGNGSLSIKGSRFAQNTAESGGALFLEKIIPTLITGTWFVENAADEQGGGILAQSALEIRSSKFLGNVAIAGGGIHSNKALELTACTVSANVAIVAGAIFHQGSDPLEIIRTKISKNVSSGGPVIVEV